MSWHTRKKPRNRRSRGLRTVGHSTFGRNECFRHRPEWLDVTPAGANNLVARLEGIGLLREITGYARNRRFRFDPYLRLFEDDREQGA